MPSVFETVTSLLAGDRMGQISRQIGADEDATASAVSAAIPILLSALARNSSTGSGASSLANALARDHDGTALDDVPGLLAGAAGGDGGGILGHVLGDRREAVESALSRTSGLDAGSTAQVLEMLAPIVMAALGRTVRQKGIDAGGLGGLLGQERAQLNNAVPGLEGLAGLLDRDGDGSVLDDLGRMAGSLFGKKG